MKIEVAIKSTGTTTEKGDLLEDLATKLLESHNYKVITKIRKTGTEKDLWCTNKTNSSKKIYVECKAYSEDNPINATIIKTLVGTQVLEKIPEVWLISTSEFGKDAKGMVEDIEKGENSKIFTFYNPTDLITTLTDSNIIIDKNTFNQIIRKDVNDENKLGEMTLLLTEYGVFWMIKVKSCGLDTGLLFAYANNGEIIKDIELLKKISDLDTTFKDLDHNTIFNFEEDSEDYFKIHPDIFLKQEYIDKSCELSININHPSNNNLSLEDIYIFPDINDTEKNENIDSKTLINRNDKRIFIFGDNLSGKTSLAFMLQKELNQKSLVPIYIKGEDISSDKKDSFIKLLEKKFKEQYIEKNIKYFHYLLGNEPQKIVIILDNFEKLLPRKSEQRNQFTSLMKDLFENIYIFSNNSMEIELISNIEIKNIFNDFKTYKIKQFGHLLRDKMIEKWLTLDQSKDRDDGDLLSEKNDITQKIKTAVGSNFIPTYPLYLLTILELTVASNKNKIQGGSYAELYGYLINQSLFSVNTKPEDLGFYHTYLSYVANHFFNNKITEISEENLSNLYKKYSLEMDLEKTYEEVHSTLIKAKILKNEIGYYSFNHNYSFYYFVAKYLSDNFEKTNIKNCVFELIENLYDDENANIIIFLTHHSKSESLIDKILEESNKIFKGILPQTLSKEEVKRINDLVHKEVSISIDSKSTKEHREEMLKAEDEDDANKEKNEKEHKKNNDGSSLYSKINLSFRLMEILGQIANNNYGSIIGEKKLIMINESYSLGLRSLRVFLDNFGEYIDSIREDILKTLKDKKINLQGDVETTVNNLIFNFFELISYSFIKKISSSVASKNLFPTIEKIKNANTSQAIELIDTAVYLNFQGKLDCPKILKLNDSFKNNYLTKSLLKILVVEHLYKFEVSQNIRQSICAKLGINISPIAISANS